MYWEGYKTRAVIAFGQQLERSPVWKEPDLQIAIARRGSKTERLNPVRYDVGRGEIRYD